MAYTIAYYILNLIGVAATLHHTVRPLDVATVPTEVVNNDMELNIFQHHKRMKRFSILLILSIITAKLFACSCVSGTITENFYKANFVAIAEILKTNTNEKGKDFYTVDISVKELYKGISSRSINIGGYNGVQQWSSCDIKLIPGSKWLFFGYKDKKGKFYSGYCSMQRADDHNFIKRKCAFILSVLKKNAGNFVEKIPYNLPYLNYDNYKTYSADKTGMYCLFSVKLDSNLNIEKIIFYTDDNEIIKKKLQNELKKCSFKDYAIKNNLNTSQGFSYIFEVYPYTPIAEPDLRIHGL
ncbi:hypothetical protein [Pedobacter sp. Leaf176]|uniref:hypothetical protein n=1 Tax=Pedobacter sp. Leaf176 TaxID=1736286 RepID=UPI0006F2C3A1|nr:hypothetical protein [Pedobacter sp. Leaf176]KQR70593.1 hypothetical protein ASF92_11545 [Pedobacter sp. Leaf176]